MTTYYAPFVGQSPAPLNINGHRLVLFCEDQSLFSEHLPLFGADRVEQITVGESSEEQASALNNVARKIHGGVVITPGEVELDDVIKNLSAQLPWLQ